MLKLVTEFGILKNIYDTNRKKELKPNKKTEKEERKQI